MAALKRLVSSLSRFISPEDAQELEAQDTGLKFISSRPAGGALNRGGRFKIIKENLHIKEVFVGEGTGRRRFVIAYNPEQAEHDRHVRKKNLERIKVELKALEKQSGKAQLKTKYALLAHKSMSRYLKELKSGKLTKDKTKVKKAEKLDGKYLLSTSDKSLSAGR